MASPVALQKWRLASQSDALALVHAAAPAALISPELYTNRTPLHELIDAGREDAVREACDKIKNGPGTSGLRLVAAAASAGWPGVVETLVNSGLGSADEVDDAGSSALHLAAEGNDSRTVTCLLALGASANSTDKLLRTPLHIAVQAGAVDCAVLLLRAGADLLAQDDRGRTAGDVADALRSRGQLDAASLAALCDLFREELDAAVAHLEAAGLPVPDALRAAARAGATVAEARPGGRSGTVFAASAATPTPAAAAPAATDHSTTSPGAERLRAVAEATGDAAAPITGIMDVDVLLALLITKFAAGLSMRAVERFEDIYAVLDSAGDGRCSAGDLASGCLAMGIEIAPELLPVVMERMTGRPDAETLSAAEFAAFCTSAAAAAAAAGSEEEKEEEATAVEAGLPPQPVDQLLVAHEQKEVEDVGAQDYRAAQ